EKSRVELEEIKHIKKDWFEISEQLDSLKVEQNSNDSTYISGLSEVVDDQIENLNRLVYVENTKFDTKSDLESLFDKVHKAAW
ncbi:hypothetical protein R0K20_22600, partial [Staphylococcus sp. SIMBA_130]